MKHESEKAPDRPFKLAPARCEVPRVVALMNQKGGVGKTTTAVNLAAAVARLGRPTLLIDLDPQSHATLHLGVDPRDVEQSVYDLLLAHPTSPDRTGVDNAMLHVRDNLCLIPATTDLAGAEVELAALDERHARLAAALSPIIGRFDFVFIDCPPSLGLLTLNGLACSREVIVPMQAQFLALQGLGKLLETVSLVGRGVNPKLHVTGVVLCMHDESTRHSKEVVADLEAFFEGSREKDVPWRSAGVFRPAIRRNIKLAECPSFGQTIFEYSPSCPGADDYGKLGATFVSQWDRFLSRRGHGQGESNTKAAAFIESRSALRGESVKG